MRLTVPRTRTIERRKKSLGLFSGRKTSRLLATHEKHQLILDKVTEDASGRKGPSGFRRIYGLTSMFVCHGLLVSFSLVVSASQLTYLGVFAMLSYL